MKILCVTFEKPSRKSGGGLGILQSLVSVCANGTVDYVGPEFNLSDFPELSLSQCFFFNRRTDVITKISNIMRGVPLAYYASWISISNSLLPDAYDVLYLDFSRYDFVARWAKVHNLPVVLRVHNIEQDYLERIAKGKNVSKSKLVAHLIYEKISKRESYCMELADQIIFLTQEDELRCRKLYGSVVSPGKCNILPVCIHEHNVLKWESPVKQPYILITGSLWYGANSDGIIWFLQNVWKSIVDQFPEVTLVVAGARPNQSVRAVCAKSINCELIDTPKDISPYFSNASLYIAPVFDGAGMKVKVAEALSYGIAVIGTPHAMIGYEAAYNVCQVVQSSDGFVQKITSSILENFKQPNRKAIMDIFKSNYTMSVSQKAIGEIIRRAVKNATSK